MERHTKKNITISPRVVFAGCQPCHFICSLQTESLEQVSFGELDYNSRCPMYSIPLLSRGEGEAT